jgi:flagellar motor switch protein FliN/FliY
LTFTEVDIRQASAEYAGELLKVMGTSPSAAPYSFSSPSGLGGDGWILIPDGLCGMLPDEALADAVGPGGPELSSDEMKDILAGFSPEDGAGGRGAAPSRPAPGNLDMVMDIRLVCTARLGRVEMPIGDILDLGPGSIIEVGHLVDEPVELLVNDKLIARGDVVVVDEKFGLRITEIISTADRIKSLR